jgi:hypothetical protein
MKQTKFIIFLLTLSVNLFSQIKTDTIKNDAGLAIGLKTYKHVKVLNGSDTIMDSYDSLMSIVKFKLVNVSADWNATFGDAVINNKPSFKTINGTAITGSGDIAIAGSGSSDEFAFTTTPVNASANKLRLYSLTGTQNLSTINSTGVISEIENFNGNVNTAYCKTIGNSTAVPVCYGMAANTVVGTVTARNVTTTNNFTYQKRTGYVSLSTVGGLASIRQATAQYTFGNTISSVKVGGFLNVIRFGISDAATVAGARMFVGMSSSVAAPTNVEPATFTNIIGIGHGASDANMKLFYGGSIAQSPIDLGINFPKTLGTGFELWLYNPIGDPDNIYYTVVNINSGTKATGTITRTVSSSLPLNTLLLNPMWAYRTNNTTALSVGLDLISQYIQTNY